MEDLFSLSRSFFLTKKRDYTRSYLGEKRFRSNLSILIGARGVGKTTAIIQFMLSNFEQDALSEKMLYVPVDHFLVGQRTLYEITEDFDRIGGQLICFDEIHRYSNWSRELKSIHDSFPRLKVIASGSSALEVHRGSHDLTRRAIVYHLPGLSFREFLELTLNLDLPVLSIEDLVQNHRALSHRVIETVEGVGHRILALFYRFLKSGYYPHFLEFGDDETLYFITLEQGIHTAIDSDLLTVHPTLSGASVQKIKRLLAFIAQSVPFKPDMVKLKRLLGIGDERTLKTYLKYLEDVAIIRSLYSEGKSLDSLNKPEKLYLNDTNLAYALGRDRIDPGNQRETFFFSAVSPVRTVSYARVGDFRIDDFVFEIGGKSKSMQGIEDIERSFLALDGLEVGYGRKIPLWLFGLLY